MPKVFIPLHPQTNGAIAQLVEQRTENPCVPGSIPGGTTKKEGESLPFFVVPGHPLYRGRCPLRPPRRRAPAAKPRGFFCAATFVATISLGGAAPDPTASRLLCAHADPARATLSPDGDYYHQHKQVPRPKPLLCSALYQSLTKRGAMLRMSIQPASRLFAGVVLTPGFPCCIHSSGESGDTEMKEPAGPRQSPLRQQFKITSPDTVFGDISNVLPPFSHEMSHFQGHLQRFTPVFVRNVPLSGTSPTPFPFPLGPGQQAGARRAFNRAPRSARPVAAGQRIFRRRCPVNIYSIFLLNALHPLILMIVVTLPTRLPHSTQIFHEKSHIWVHLQRFACVFARDVPHSGTFPPF